MDTATATQTYTSQFRMAIYDFGASAQTRRICARCFRSRRLTSAKTAAGNIDLMTVNGQNDNNDQDTQYTKRFRAINGVITEPGTGHCRGPAEVSVLRLRRRCRRVQRRLPQAQVGAAMPVADQSGALHDAQGSRHQDRGAVHHLSRSADQRLVQDWIKPFNAGTYGPSPNSQIAQNMQTCASPGLYFEVSPTQGISEAMNALFQKAVADARISS